MKHTIKIEKVGNQWVVGKPAQTPMRPHDFVEWRLDGSNVSAHFQFTWADSHPIFKKGQPELTDDLTAEIPPGKNTLTLQLDPKIDNRKLHRYAVWIQEWEWEKEGEGWRRAEGMFAVGSDLNPPPELNVGP